MNRFTGKQVEAAAYTVAAKEAARQAIARQMAEFEARNGITKTTSAGKSNYVSRKRFEIVRG